MVLLLLTACQPSGLEGWFLNVYGKVVDEDGVAMSGVSVELEAADGMPITTLTTDETGSWSMPIYGNQLTDNLLIARANANGYTEGLATFEVNLQSPISRDLNAGPGQTFRSTDRHLSTIHLAREAEQGIVYGRLLDAVTGAAVPSIALSLQPGWNASIGEGVSGSTTTDLDGNFSFVSAAPGMYTVLAAGNDIYDIARFPVLLTASGTTMNATISTPTRPGTLRAALVWNTNGLDLDLHLTAEIKNTEGDSRYHVWSGYPQHPEVLRGDDDPVAMMERSDADGFGPETLAMLDRPVEGEIHISVLDNTHFWDDSSTALGDAEALLQVWYGEDIPRYYLVSPGEVATFWQPARIGVDATTYVLEEYATGVEPDDTNAF